MTIRPTYRIILILVCLLLIPFHAIAQDGSETQKIQAKIDTATIVSNKLNLYTDLAWEYMMSENDSAIFVAEKALAFSQENDYKLGEAIALETKGLYYEMIKGDYEFASQFYFEAIEICETSNLNYATSIYHSLGVLFHTSDNYEKAKEYYTITYERAKKEGKIELQKKSLINLGSVNSSLENYEVAEELFLKSLTLNIRQELDFDVNANLGNLYRRQKKPKKAIPYLEKAIEQVPENPSSEANLYFLIYAKIDLKDTVGMQKILARAIAHINESKGMRNKSIMTMAISNYYRAFGDFEKALKYRDDYLTLYEEIKEKQRDETVYNLEANYQTEKKEREIIQQKLIIESKEKQKNKILFGLISLAALSIFLILFFRNRLKYQKTIALQNETLQQQKIEDLRLNNKVIALNSMIEGQEAERFRIAKDLHDSLGGLLSTIKTHFTSIQKEQDNFTTTPLTQKTTELIDEACIEVRRISHNMIPHALSLSGLKGAIEDLGEQLNVEGYQTTVEINSPLKSIDETKKIMIYRLVQEIISNVKKHAQAKTILLQLFLHQKEITLMVEDDGIGFNYQQALKKEGLGLKSINTRIEFLDGKIDWDSQIDQGTTIIINIPI